MNRSYVSINDIINSINCFRDKKQNYMLIHVNDMELQNVSFFKNHEEAHEAMRKCVARHAMVSEEFVKERYLDNKNSIHDSNIYIYDNAAYFRSTNKQDQCVYDEGSCYIVDLSKNGVIVFKK